MKGRSGVAFTPGSQYFRASFEVPSPLGWGGSESGVANSGAPGTNGHGVQGPFSCPALPIPRRVRTSITPSIHSRTFPKGHAQAQGCPVPRAFLLAH